MSFVKQIKEAGVLEGVVLLGFDLAFKGRRTKVRCFDSFFQEHGGTSPCFSSHEYLWHVHQPESAGNAERPSIRTAAPPSCGFLGRPKVAWPHLPTEGDGARGLIRKHWPEEMAQGLGPALAFFQGRTPPGVSFMSFPGWMRIPAIIPAILAALRGDPWCCPERT